MLAIVTNFGRPRVFPCRQGNLWFNRLSPVEVRDREVIKELQKYNERRDIQLKIELIKDPIYPGKKIEKEIVSEMKYIEFDDFKMNYTKFKIQQLRSMAAAKGIKGTFKMTKKLLIEKLEEKDGISKSIK